ncbi:hypothetical protein CP556_06410 [Natrinema sp. CBA1119]|nr:hypothetical protein CP556_06410 [Natrinema sp. CBA1119]
MTGTGYEYVRCRRGDHDDTVYIHQLCAIAAGEDPHKVFHTTTEIHHICPIPWLNTPENVECVTSWEHPNRPVEDEPRLSKEVFTYEGPGESTVHGVPESEYERLEAIATDGGPSEDGENDE